MARKSKTKSAYPRIKIGRYVRATIRFADDEHLNLVREAAAASKIPLNAWLIRVTVEAARRELRRMPVV